MLPCFFMLLCSDDSICHLDKFFLPVYRVAFIEKDFLLEMCLRMSCGKATLALVPDKYGSADFV
jgi:hypothetical protein